MKTIRTKVYQFNELSESAQSTAISNFINLEREFFWGDEWMQSLKQGLEFYGFELGNRYSIDYSSASGSYAPVISNHDNNIEDLSGVRLWKYLQNNYSTYFCKYDKKQKPTLDGNCPFTGYCGDENFLEPIREFIKKPSNITFSELMEECVFNTLKGCEQDHDYQNSEEYAREELLQSEEQYTKDGLVFNY